MAQLKKNIARLVLQGISILGLLLGISLFCFAIVFIFSIQRDNLVILCLWLIISGGALVLGIYMMYTSYLMFRWRAFGAMEWISVLLAISSFGWVHQLVEFLATTSGSGRMPRFVEDIAYVADLPLPVLVYLICIKLLKKLLEVADSPKKISATQPSTDKQ